AWILPLIEPPLPMTTAVLFTLPSTWPSICISPSPSRSPVILRSVLKMDGIWVLPRGVASAGSGALVAVAENIVSCLCCVVPPKNDFIDGSPVGPAAAPRQRAQRQPIGRGIGARER